MAHHETGEYITAIAEYDLAIKLNPSHSSAYYNRGLVCWEIGHVPNASSDLAKCIGLSTDIELAKSADQALFEIRTLPWEH